MRRIVKLLLKAINQKGITKITLTYRYCSLIISSLIYWISEPVHTVGLKLGVISGMLIACTILVYLYINSRDNPRHMAILVGIELIGNSVLIIASGGFASPYIWYSLSTLMLVMREFAMKWTVLTTMIYFISAFTTTFVDPLNIELVRLYINIGMSYLMVVAGLWCLLHYAIDIETKNKKLYLLNQELQQEKKKVEKALQYTIEMYETVDIFTMNSEKSIMEALLAHFQTLVSTKACMLVKMNRMGEIRTCCERGMGEREKEMLFKMLVNIDSNSSTKNRLRCIKKNNKKYLMTLIEYASETYSILVFKPSVEFEAIEGNSSLDVKEKEIKYFKKLAGIMLKKIDLEQVVEGLIVSEEQNRIANEIHDTVIQKLFAIACNVFVLESQCEGLGTEEVKQQLRQIKGSIDGTMRELREAIYGLSWEKQGEDTFRVKLRGYIEELKQLHGIDIEAKIEGDTQAIGINQKTALYRVICEAINNGIRHGKADKIQILMKIEDTVTSTQIKDNGIGFESEKYRGKDKGGLGLKNMYKIIGLLRGIVEIKTKERQGTTVKVTLPREDVV